MSYNNKIIFSLTYIDHQYDKIENKESKGILGFNVKNPNWRKITGL